SRASSRSRRQSVIVRGALEHIPEHSPSATGLRWPFIWCVACGLCTSSNSRQTCCFGYWFRKSQQVSGGIIWRSKIRFGIVVNIAGRQQFGLTQPFERGMLFIWNDVGTRQADFKSESNAVRSESGKAQIVRFIE